MVRLPLLIQNPPEVGSSLVHGEVYASSLGFDFYWHVFRHSRWFPLVFLSAFITPALDDNRTDLNENTSPDDASKEQEKKKATA